MKKLFVALFCVSSMAGYSQCAFGPAQYLNAYYEYKALKARYILQVPRSLVTASCRDTGFVYYNPTDSALHWWTGSTDRTFLVFANQGVTDSSNTVQLGEPLNQVANAARFTQNRELPLNGRTWHVWDSLNNFQSGFLDYNDTAHTSLTAPVVVQTIHQADTANLFYNWEEWRPRNYGYLYPSYKPNGALAKAMSWSWGYSQNDPGGLTMPDNVFGGGYNMLNATTRRDTGDAALSLRVETSFPVNGEPNFEMHWPEVTHFDGSLQRVNSWYIGKTTGRVFQEKNLDEVQYKRAEGTNPGGLWMDFTSNTGDFGLIKLFGTHANSFDGEITFTDSVVALQTQIRANAGQLQLVSTVGEAAYMDVDGSMFFNFSENAQATNGRTTVGNPTGLEPANHASAQLRVLSNDSTRGFLPPQMTTVQKLAIVNPASGLMVYDITLNQMAYYNGTSWVNF